MNHLFILTLSAISCCHAATETEVVFADGSRVRGSLNQLSPNRLELSSPMLAKPAPLRLSQILEISLNGRFGDSEGNHVATVTLTNGDVLSGELSELNQDHVRLRTWYAGDLTFRRSMVESLEIADRPNRIYYGPDDLASWNLSQPGSWAFQQGAFVSQSRGTISKEFELPQRCRFAFDVSWRNSPNFRFLFLTDDATQENPDNCYDLVVQQSRFVHLRKRYSRNGRSGYSPIGSTNVPEMTSREKVRLELMIDRTSGAIRLVVNGRVAADWVDGSPKEGQHGGGIHFVCDDGSPTRISRIEVTDWSGITDNSAQRLVQMADPFAEHEGLPQEEEKPKDIGKKIRLRNNDEVDGETAGIENGMVRLKTAYGDLKIPVNRLRTFGIHTAETRKDLSLWEKPRAYERDVRAWFPDGNKVTFRLERAEKGRLVGYSQTFGEATFDLQAFQRIEFNVWESEFEDARENLAW